MEKDNAAGSRIPRMRLRRNGTGGLEAWQTGKGMRGSSTHADVGITLTHRH